MGCACHLSFSSFPFLKRGSNTKPLTLSLAKEPVLRKRCEESCSKEEIDKCSWKGKVKLKCKGRDIDPEFRENYCGQKRVSRGFPCCACDLLEKGGKRVLFCGTCTSIQTSAKRHPPRTWGLDCNGSDKHSCAGCTHYVNEKCEDVKL